MGNYNSSELAARIAKKLNMNEENELQLFKELSQIGDGPVKDALDALSRKEETNRYVAVIRSSCVRDAQYSKHVDAEWDDDDVWCDVKNGRIFLEVIEADTPTRARQIAAVKAGVDTEVVELYDLNVSCKTIL